MCCIFVVAMGGVHFGFLTVFLATDDLVNFCSSNIDWSVSHCCVQEKWSFGLEWDLIEYALDVYLMLVVGEGRHPVSVGAGSGYPGSSSGGNSPMVQGNTGLVPIKHHTARSEWPQQVCNSLFFLFL